MARVKIKVKNSQEGQNKIQLLRILSQNQVYATKIITLPDGYVVLTKSDDDLDIIFSKDIKAILTEANFSPLVPPELKAKRSVILFRVDDHIYNNSAEEIKGELINENTWIRDDIE